MIYEIGQAVLYRTYTDPEIERYEIGIIVQIDECSSKYPYRIIFSSDYADDDWYSSPGVEKMVEDYRKFLFKMHEENVKENTNGI